MLRKICKHLKKITKKSLISFFILFFLFSPAINIASAQSLIECFNLAGKTVDINQNPVSENICSNLAKAQTDGSFPQFPADIKKEQDQATFTAAQTAASSDSGTQSSSPCGLWGSILTLGACNVIFGLFKLLINIFGGLTYLSTMLFDKSVSVFILNIKDIFKDTSSAENGVYIAWKVIRDIANIAGFFGAIYAGLMYIIGSNNNIKKIFVNLMMFAILTNFSFPIAKFFIDISNVVSLNVYGSLTNYDNTKNVGDLLMQQTGLSLFIANEQKISSGAGDNLSSWTVTFLLILYLIFTMFIFFEAALFVLMRGLMLVLYVIFSPLMFIGGLAPFLTRLHDDWRKRFVGELLVGPLLMIFIWVAMQILGVTNTILSAANISNINGSNSQIITQSLTLIFSGLALHYAIKMTKEYSYEAGALVSGVMSGVGTLAGVAATGGASFALRNTVGRAGAMMAESNWVKQGTQSNNIVRRMTSRGLGNTGKAMTKTSGNFAGAGVTKFMNTTLGTNAINVKIGKSYKDKMDNDREKYIDDNSDSLKESGLRDAAKRSKTTEQLENIKEVHTDLISTNEEKNIKNKLVLNNLNKEKQEREDKLKRITQIESNTINPTTLREDRINKVLTGRQEQIKNTVADQRIVSDQLQRDLNKRLGSTSPTQIATINQENKRAADLRSKLKTQTPPNTQTTPTN